MENRISRAQFFSEPKVTPLQNRKAHRIWPTIFSQGSHFNKNNISETKKNIFGPQGGGHGRCGPLGCASVWFVISKGFSRKLQFLGFGFVIGFVICIFFIFRILSIGELLTWNAHNLDNDRLCNASVCIMHCIPLLSRKPKLILSWRNSKLRKVRSILSYN